MMEVGETIATGGSPGVNRQAYSTGGFVKAYETSAHCYFLRLLLKVSMKNAHSSDGSEVANT
jgi:hypothetical protein